MREYKLTLRNDAAFPLLEIDDRLNRIAYHSLSAHVHPSLLVNHLAAWHDVLAFITGETGVLQIIEDDSNDTLTLRRRGGRITADCLRPSKGHVYNISLDQDSVLDALTNVLEYWLAATE